MKDEYPSLVQLVKHVVDIQSTGRYNNLLTIMQHPSVESRPILVDPKYQPRSVRVKKPSSFRQWSKRNSSTSSATCESSVSSASLSTGSFVSLTAGRVAQSLRQQRSSNTFDGNSSDWKNDVAETISNSPRRHQRKIFIRVGNASSGSHSGDTCSESSGSPKTLRSFKRRQTERNLFVNTNTKISKEKNPLAIEGIIPIPEDLLPNIDLNEFACNVDEQGSNSPTKKRQSNRKVNTISVTSNCCIETKTQILLHVLFTHPKQNKIPSSSGSTTSSIDDRRSDDLLYLNGYTGPVDVDSILDDEMNDLECRLMARKQYLFPNQEHLQHNNQQSSDPPCAISSCEPSSNINKPRLVRDDTGSSAMSRKSIRSASSSGETVFDFGGIAEGLDQTETASISASHLNPKSAHSVVSTTDMSESTSGPVDVDDYIPEDSAYFGYDCCESYVIDEVEYTRGLAGYEVGFEPENIWNYESYQLRREFSREFVPPPIFEKDDDDDTDDDDEAIQRLTKTYKMKVQRRSSSDKASI